MQHPLHSSFESSSGAPPVSSALGAAAAVACRSEVAAVSSLPSLSATTGGAGLLMTPGAERIRSAGGQCGKHTAVELPEMGLPRDDPSAASHPGGTTVRLPFYLTAPPALANISFIAIFGKNNIFAA